MVILEFFLVAIVIQMLNKFDDSFLLKVGVQIHKNWGIYAQYLGGIAVTNGGYFQMSSSCEQVGINYFFK